MSKRISCGFTRIRLLNRDELRATADLSLLDDEFEACFTLDSLLDDHHAMHMLRELYAERLADADAQLRSDHEVLSAVKRLVRVGELSVIRENVFVPSGRVTRTEAPAEPENPEPPPPDEKKHWIKFKAVDDATGNPISGVKLHVREPRGQERDYTTRPDGMVEIDPVDAGVCDLSGPSNFASARLGETLDFVGMGEAPIEPKPEGSDGSRPRAQGRLIAEIAAHKVQTGETLDSVARGAGLTWQELARFNWGTSVPKQINDHLRDEVGCTKKTQDGHNYIFTSDDDPGIVYVPRPWEQTGLATDRTHVVRVRNVKPKELVDWEFSI